MCRSCRWRVDAWGQWPPGTTMRSAKRRGWRRWRGHWRREGEPMSDERSDARDEPSGEHEAQAHEAYDAVVAELVETAVATSGSMFGMPGLKANGKAFAGYFHGAMVFKLGAPEH